MPFEQKTGFACRAGPVFLSYFLLYFSLPAPLHFVHKFSQGFRFYPFPANQPAKRAFASDKNTAFVSRFRSIARYHMRYPFAWHRQPRPSCGFSQVRFPGVVHPLRLCALRTLTHSTKSALPLPCLCSAAMLCAVCAPCFFATGGVCRAQNVPS